MCKIEETYAKENCPFKIGEIVEILGNSHNGKGGIIHNISGQEGWFDNKLEWKVTGNVLKKDGTEGMQYFSFNENDYNRSKEI
jgi:hypothetical protein